MTINGEKAPGFSAKTLNLPQAPDNATNQIIELSRQRYARDRVHVEALVQERVLKRQTTPEALPAPNNNHQQQQSPQLSRPRAQAQLNKLEEKPKPSVNPSKFASTLIKAVTGGGNGSESATMQVQQSSQQPTEPRKRKRTRRGGKNRKSRNQAVPQQTSSERPVEHSQERQPSSSSEDHVIHLR
jgi:hypothetical protein